MNMVQQLIDQAISKQQEGNLKDAERLYRQALKQSPADADALRCYLNLGEILVTLEKPKLAIGVYNMALRQYPESVDLLNALGITQAQAGNLETAVNCLQKALTLESGNAVHAFNLAKIYKQQANLLEAERYYRQAIRLQPDMAIAYNNLGNILVEQGRHPEAEEHYRKAVKLNPDYALAYNNLGKLLHQLDRPEEAIPVYQQAIRLKADYVEACYGLIEVLKAVNKFREAIYIYNNVVKHLKEPLEQAKIYYVIGTIYMKLDQIDAATESFKQAIKLDPNYTDAENSLGTILFLQQRYQEAEVLYNKILNKAPHSHRTYLAMGNIRRMQLRHEDAVACYEKAIQLKHDFKQAQTNRLFALSYNVMRDPDEILSAHVEWNRQFAAPEERRFKHSKQGEQNKRLRIGYLSPDFRMHSVAYFFEPILANHNHDEFEIFCYAEVANPDYITSRLQKQTDLWCFTTGMRDEKLAKRIYDDKINILIDLGGHTQDSRILACTRKPAPIQATYLGYFCTTGLDTMDYWISDAVLTPQDTIEKTVETIYNLDRCCLAFTPPEDIPEVSPRPQSNTITFGSFNDLTKICDKTIELWASVLKAIPKSQLLLKAMHFHDGNLQKLIFDKFSRYGITSDRIELRSRTPSKRDHLALYGNIDIALDTIPRTGGATTMEALWMGVPVVTLAGKRFIERLSASMLTAINHNDWIASTRGEYVAKAVALAQNSAQRADLRLTLRQQVMASSISDGKGLARALEKAYRNMWQIYLSGKRI